MNDYEYYDEVTRLPPHSTNAEQALLGACLLNPQCLDEICDLLFADDFYSADHKATFEAISQLHFAHLPVDALTVAEKLKQNGLFDQVGGQGFIAGLLDSVASVGSESHYASIIKEKSLRRKLISTSGAIVQDSFNEEKNTDQVLEEAERSIFDVIRGRTAGSFVKISSALQGSIEALEQAYANKGRNLTGISSGFYGFDRLTNGLQRGALNILAARPAMGKSALALNIATHVALREHLPVLIFSLEMSANQLATRMLGALAGVNLQKLIHGSCNPEEWDQLVQAGAKLSGLNIEIDESSFLTIAEARARCRRFAARNDNKLGLVVVDYLQMVGGVRNLDNKVQEIGEVSRGLKGIAREFDVPVLALSQLSRAVEARQDKRPQLSDLRESGAIEQDADVVCFLYRKAYYQEKESQVDPAKQVEIDNTAQLDIAKHRSGPTGIVNLLFRKELTKFENLTTNY